MTGRRRGASFAVFFVFCMRSVCQSVTAISRVISKVIHWWYYIETLAARPDAVPAGLYPAVPGTVLRAVCTSRTTAAPNKSLRTALPGAVSYEYRNSALLSGADGVRASEGFPCAAAATEPTGCALPEGPGRARWQARERSERVRRGRQRGSGGDALPALYRSQRGRGDDAGC